MRKVQKTASDRMEWRESRQVKRQDELCKGEHVLATLRWQGCFSRRASARASAGRWTFDQPGLLSKDVTVWAAESDQPVATFKAGWTGDGTLEYADGRTWRWMPTNFWQTRWSFATPSGRPVVRFQDTSGLLERKSEMEFAATDISQADGALLALLGRYLMVRRAEDTAAAAAAAGAGV